MSIPHLDSERSLAGIVFHQEELMPELPDTQFITDWINMIVKQEARNLQCVFFVFLDDVSLSNINRTHLQHDTLTDILTFPYSVDPIEAEIYISADRVRANAHTYQVSVKQELLRVIAHGVLHLCGWNDKSESESQLMRKREDACLALIGFYHPVSSLSP
jgi:rRNA maturation RNase YbeY